MNVVPKTLMNTKTVEPWEKRRSVSDVSCSDTTNFKFCLCACILD